MQPETKYARSRDIRIGYQVTGQGPTDLVWAPGTVSHLDLDWEHPAKPRFIRDLSAFCRLIRFDKRGTGLSDHPPTVATLEERIDDIRAVLGGGLGHRFRGSGAPKPAGGCRRMRLYKVEHDGTA